MQVTAAQIAQLVGATVEGDPDVTITGPAKIEEAATGTITFFGNPAYERFLYTTEASAVLVPTDFQPREPLRPTLLRVDDVYMTISKLLEHYQQQAGATAKTISAHAIVEDSATIGENVRVGKLSVVSEGASVGAGSVIHDQVFIGPRVTVGTNCVLHPGVRILADCLIGNNCTLHANAVVGGDGFGFVPDPETGAYKKIPQVGNVILEDDVEIGANTTIDRASMGSTILRRGVKLDNLIQVAHNVEIKENTVIAALTGIAGSAKVGANCRIGGQVGISGHITVADGTQVQAQTGITNSVKEEGQALAGTPFMPWRDFTKSAAAFKMLPGFIKDVRKRLRNLEK
ncbi:UDP-3-O-(3-hydroxymyristoyl)glucosamine N-acyltransferase [Lewinella sp. 4G2]|uniref:UDP-3-O-(3-hydroxymyristoyl)glucosamine N-acyltransferase n=1 Tax=Lewinella sp. 4G2 TaxID=1803372 RepID=UPI0007B4EF2E|nr:UDP-3-O-(3-hydroxymyristoyl)glucosamine N-acyltransferase [Lewinella sp. 4G2]OAV45484.1 UDP-3-O-(3-hydroxymyristoyl)glucosamine N-acyltransferase [Lewinella sp. 4G2]